MIKHLITSICLLASVVVGVSQNIPDDRKVDWSIVGHEGEIPCALTLRNAITEFSIDNTGANDVTTAVNAALLAIEDDEALYFPAGTYLLEGEVNIPSNRVIRGESPSLTIFHLDYANEGTGFTISGAAEGTESSISAVGAFGEYTITLNSTAGFSVGDDIEIAQANDPAIHGAEDAGDLTAWAENLKGQLAVITAINGSVVTIDRSLAFDYDISFAMSARKLNLAENAGIENLKIIRVSDNGTGAANNNVWLAYTKNCWMRKVHLEYSSRYHVRIEYSRNFEATECFIDKAYNCGGGGAGYGFLIQDHVTECLFENNIANALRHPWIPKEGAVRNVFAYNYSYGTTQGAACDADPLTDSYADISVHGHYPAFNLFEGNIVYRIGSSDAWGPNGPGNTFFRNRVLGLKGIWIQSYTKSQNVIGNELTHPSAQFEMDRDGTIDGTTLHYDNYDTNGLLDDAAPSTVASSYYLSGKPAFFGANTWPSIGPGVSFNTGEIPAQQRFNSGDYFTEGPVCSACQIPQLGEDVSLCGKTEIELNSNIVNGNLHSYKWLKDGVLLADSTRSSLLVKVAGKYTLETDSAACTGKDEINVLAKLPQLDLGESQNLCKPSQITLMSNVVDPSYSYQWSKDGHVIEGAKTDVHTVGNAGLYALTVDADGCPAVEAEVIITSELLDVQGEAICTPGTVELIVNGTSTYNWYSDLTTDAILDQGAEITYEATETTTLFVEDSKGFSVYVGRVAPDFSGSNTWDDNAYDRKLKFEVYTTLILDSISFYPSSVSFPANASSVTVRIMEANNSTIAFTKTYDNVVAETENRVQLGKELEPGSYFLDFEGTTGELYYSNQNDLATVYPYEVEGVISIVGAEPSWITAKPYYMYAYNWKVSTGNSCDRTPVEVTVDPTDPACQVTAQKDDVIDLTAYPNPTDGEVYLSKTTHWMLRNSLGQVLESNTTARVNLSAYPAGIYVLQLPNSTIQLIKE